MSDYPWRRTLARIFNNGRSRTVILSGNVHDLLHIDGKDSAGSYVPLIAYLASFWGNLENTMMVIYEVNEGVRFVRESDQKEFSHAYDQWGRPIERVIGGRVVVRTKAEGAAATSFEGLLDATRGNPTGCLELLRAMCSFARMRDERTSAPFIAKRLVIVVEGADLLLPNAPVNQLSDAMASRLAILHDWFTEDAFVNGNDSVILMAESRSQLHDRISRLPMLEEVEVPSPDEAERLSYIRWFDTRLPPERKLKAWSTLEELAAYTGGLSVRALRQLLVGAEGESILPGAVVDKVEQFLKSQIGEDVIAFKRPTHAMKDLQGNAALLAWITAEFIPRVRSTDPDVAYAAAIVGGPIRTGKTYIFEAVAGELGIPVIELKNFRSMWVGQTDVAIERIYRALRVITKGIVLIDEADTQFGGVGRDVHETEKRATGKFQQMMSDPALRGRIMWLMLTARIHLLSPDLRGEGRGGDCIVVVQDPEPGSPDHHAFVQFMLKGRVADEIPPEQLERIHDLTRGYYAGAFQTVRSELKAQRKLRGRDLTVDEVVEIIGNKVMSDTAKTRRYQLLQALVNCTDRRLLPPNSTDDVREGWKREIVELEAQGIR